MRNLIIAAAMILPVLATGALAAKKPVVVTGSSMNMSQEDETCTFEPSTGTYGACSKGRSHAGQRDHGRDGGRDGGRNGGHR